MEIIIIGTGGLAKELYGMLTSMDERVIGFIEKEFAGEPTTFCGLPVLGVDAWFVRQPTKYAIIANGQPGIRRKIHEYYRQSAHHFPWLIHPRAIIFSNLTPGDGTTIMPGGVIQPDTRIGRFTHINMGVTIGHDVQIGDYCVINHNAGISGNVRLGNGVLVGAGATIRENLTIGEGATVGMGAVVTKNVPAGETWVGNPARPLERKPHLTLAEAYGIDG